MPFATSSKTIQTTNFTGTSPFESLASGSHPLAPFFKAAAYDEMYAQGLWPATAVDKLTSLHAALPGKTYDRQGDGGREEAPDSPFGRLMANPSPESINPDIFRRWMISMHHIHGAAFARKVLDGRRGGLVVGLDPIHPTRMRYGPKNGEWVAPPVTGIEQAGNRWWLRQSDGSERQIARPEFLFWPRFNPSSPNLWLSPFEPLRETLEAEHTVRKANRAMWRNGGRHQIALTHPSRFNNPLVTQALRAQYAERYGGVDNHGKPLVLQEGMTVAPIPVQEELEYVDTRKLNREEVAARFDIPPPAIHILDRATFSNITEQIRMLYKITIPPHLTSYEAAIEFDVRDGSYNDGPPNFGDRYYFEWLLDGALRGDFETRIDTYSKAIQTGQMTPAEARENENRPFVPGSDQLLINAAVVPIEEASRTSAEAAADNPLPDDGTIVDEGISSLSFTPIGDRELSTVMGRVGRTTDVRAVDVDRVVDGLSDHAARQVRLCHTYAVGAGSSMPQFREAIKRMRQ